MSEFTNVQLNGVPLLLNSTVNEPPIIHSMTRTLNEAEQLKELFRPLVDAMVAGKGFSAEPEWVRLAWEATRE